MILLFSTTSTSSLMLVGDGSGNYPTIGWKNQVTTSNIAATTADASYPVTNLANPATHLRWQGTSTAIHYLTVSALAGNVDYVAVAKHNFGSAGISVQVEGALDGVTFLPLSTSTLITDDSPLMIVFSKAAYQKVRLKLSSGSVVPRAAVMFVGEALIVPSKLYVGHTPIKYGRSRNIVTSRSESGNFLGRVVVGGKSSTKVSLPNLDATFFRTYVDPFIDYADSAPFFFAWRPVKFPREVGYAWLTDDAAVVNQRSNGMMQADLSLTGIL